MKRYRRNPNAFTKRDANHHPIVEALQKAGVHVMDLAHVGRGITDLLCQHRKTRELLLLEIKNGEAKREDLTPAQIKFRKSWPAIVVVDAREALAACGVETYEEK